MDTFASILTNTVESKRPTFWQNINVWQIDLFKKLGIASLITCWITTALPRIKEATDLTIKDLSRTIG